MINKINSIINSAIVTIRYFGGVKLGKSNLFKAYLNTANEAVKNALFEELIELEEFIIEFPYNYYEKIFCIFSENNVDIISKDFSDLINIVFKVPKNLVNKLFSEIKSICPEIKIKNFSKGT